MKNNGYNFPLKYSIEVGLPIQMNTQKFVRNPLLGEGLGSRDEALLLCLNITIIISIYIIKLIGMGLSRILEKDT